MYVMPVVLFNSRSTFVFKIELFRCNINETSITLIIFIFFFIEKTFKNGKYTVGMRTYSPGLNSPSLCTHPYAFVMTSPSPYLRNDPLGIVSIFCFQY